MPKHFFKRLTRNSHDLKKNPYLKCFGSLLHDPNLWHLNRRSSSGGMALGLFCAFVPIPSQMLLSAALAIFFRVNLPLSVAMVWLTNPITIPPMFYGAYKLGAWILGEPILEFQFQLSFEWLMEMLSHIWLPLLLGSFLLSTVCSIVGYFAVRGLWRLQVVRGWEKRRAERQARVEQALKHAHALKEQQDVLKN